MKNSPPAGVAADLMLMRMENLTSSVHRENSNSYSDEILLNTAEYPEITCFYIVPEEYL